MCKAKTDKCNGSLIGGNGSGELFRGEEWRKKSYLGEKVVEAAATRLNHECTNGNESPDEGRAREGSADGRTGENSFVGVKDMSLEENQG